MPDSYYPEDGAAGPQTETPPPEKDTEEGAEPTTALLPKSILAGKDLKPGDEIMLKITHIYEDEVAVEYASSEPEEKPEPTADEEIDAAAEKGIQGPPMTETE